MGQPELPAVAQSYLVAALRHLARECAVPERYEQVEAALEQARALGIAIRKAKEEVAELIKPYKEEIERIERSAKVIIEDAEWLRSDIERAAVRICRDNNAPIPAVMPIRVDTVPVVRDPAALPRKYLIPNLKAIREAVASGMVVPGVELEERITFYAREEKE